MAFKLVENSQNNMYVHFPKVNHVPVEFVDFVFAVFCFTFRHGIHSPDYSKNILSIYGSQNWDTVGIARLVIFSVQEHDVFGVKDFFFQPRPC